MCPSTLSLPVRHHLPPSFPGGLRRRPGLFPSHRVAAFGWDYSGGRLVDESMIVLRKRIHEMKMAETNYEPPADWMDWEKRYYATYHADVCEVMCLLQTVLMSTRPSWAIGIFAAVTLSVPASAVLISVHLLEALNSLISR
ncbi:uncharacterized protein LOC121973795 [Zingiber officinale]|uniref:Mediator of RNA polymerase II transcription subunit n=1 Tax=Zingiber officinale TaxID=94328 RepID=A0A8J5LI57_ZINOF|nr:uncharacterized protein LOC121973795 [Zingiber officinale]KAG6516272.1 hypothetical protein ZIOFF_026727 [Zingiber officinale]